MKIRTTGINGVCVLENNTFSDQRGSFSRLFCDRELSSILNQRQIVQINLSKTKKKGSIRGMHFQYPPHAEMKLVRCLKGRVFDVAVDLRADSKTYLHWYAQKLSPKDNNAMVIPEGCAHGFQTLEEDTELLYLHTSHYEPNYESGIRHNDPKLNIQWPMDNTDISEKDQRYPMIDNNFKGIML